MLPAPHRVRQVVRRAGGGNGRLCAEALCWLAAARLLVMTGSFPLVARRLAGGASFQRRAIDGAELRKIGWALTAVGKRVPWRCKCLERAIAGTIMLRLRGRPATLFLGVARSEPGGALEAHAWLRCGDLPVVGEEITASSYTVLARFGDGDTASNRG